MFCICCICEHKHFGHFSSSTEAVQFEDIFRSTLCLRDVVLPPPPSLGGKATITYLYPQDAVPVGCQLGTLVVGVGNLLV